MTVCLRDHEDQGPTSLAGYPGLRSPWISPAASRPLTLGRSITLLNLDPADPRCTFAAWSRSSIEVLPPPLPGSWVSQARWRFQGVRAGMVLGRCGPHPVGEALSTAGVKVRARSMGTLYYSETPIRIEDRALAHLKAVISTKLRRAESFHLVLGAPGRSGPRSQHHLVAFVDPASFRFRRSGVTRTQPPVDPTSLHVRPALPGESCLSPSRSNQLPECSRRLRPPCT